MIELTTDEAEILVHFIDYSHTVSRTLERTFAVLGEHGIDGIGAIATPAPAALEAISAIRDRLQTAANPRHLVLRIVAMYGDTARTDQVAELVHGLGLDAEAVLDALLDDELVRRLSDGRGNQTWELTPAGEAQL